MSSSGEESDIPRQTRKPPRRILDDSDDEGSRSERSDGETEKKKPARRAISSGSESEGDGGKKRKASSSGGSGSENDGGKKGSGSDSEEEKPKKKERKPRSDDDSEDEEKEEDEEDEGKKRKDKKRRRYEEEVDDEDLALLEENMGISRDNEGSKLKRIRKGPRAESDEDEDDLGMGSDTEQRRRKRDEDFFNEEEGEVDDIDDFIADRPDREVGDDRGDDGADAYDAMEIFGDGNFDEWMDHEEGGQERDYHEYEDEDEEDGDLPRRKKKEIEDMYEPTVLEQKMMTKKDEEIKTTDIPERIQLSHIKRGDGQVSDEELQEEAEWIYRVAFRGRAFLPAHPPGDRHRYSQRTAYDGIDPSMPDTAIESIKNVLMFLRREHYEVPFIYHYRQEYLDPGYTPSERRESPMLLPYLWHIHDWDAKWERYLSLRTSLMKLYNSIVEYQSEVRSSARPQASEAERQQIEKAANQEELNDWQAYILFKYKEDLERIRAQADIDNNDDDGANITLPRVRRDIYTIAAEAGLGGLAEQYGLTAGEFAENLSERRLIHEARDPPLDPLTTASGYVTNNFSINSTALKGAAGFLMKELSHHPLVRSRLRQVFLDNVVVTVTPTDMGLTAIDEWHEYAPFKFLKDKPLSAFKVEAKHHGVYRTDKEFLRMLKAESEGFIKIAFDLGESDGPLESRTAFRNISDLYRSRNQNEVAKKWNEQRAALIKALMQSFLFPQFEKELRSQLSASAREVVLEEMGGKLRETIFRRPFTAQKDKDNHRTNRRGSESDSSDDESDDEQQQENSIIGIYLGTQDRPTICALINGYGTMLDHLTLKNMHMREVRYPEGVEQRNDPKSVDKMNLEGYIKRKRPIGIAVIVEDTDSMRIAKDIEYWVRGLQDTKQIPNSTRVEWIQAEVPRIYAQSTRAKEEFPEFPVHLLHAISAARYLQDPLVELAAMCNYEDEITAINLHPLQHTITKEERRNVLDRQFVDVVNMVGVRINEIAPFKHRQCLLQFVAGFGPRKAMEMFEKLADGVEDDENDEKRHYVCDREELIMKGFVMAKVFENCAGFICILGGVRLPDQPKRSEVCVLDCTRIHPESYKYARKIAKDALDEDEDNEDDDDIDKAVELVMADPKQLDDLQLDVFAQQLEKKNIRKGVTVYLIREELRHPYRDHRHTLPDFREENLPGDIRQRIIADRFYMVTSETSETLCVDMQVDCKVRDKRTGRDGTAMGVDVIVLPSELKGFIHISKFSDHRLTEEELDERLEIGGTLVAKIIKVDMEKFVVDLTCMSSDLQQRAGRLRDLWYDTLGEAAAKAKETEKIKKKAKAQRAQRAIDHPLFKSMTFDEAEEYLSKSPPGTAVIRPSTRSTHLSLSWKVYDGIICHQSIEEKDRADPFSLGRTLILDGDKYEDLDEMDARYIQPLAQQIRAVTHNKYFVKPMPEEEIEFKLQGEKNKAPQRIPYHLCFSRQYPGKVLLAYMASSRGATKEYITLHPQGLRYQKQHYSSLDKLLNSFKKSCTDRIKQKQALAAQQQYYQQQGYQGNYYGQAPAMGQAPPMGYQQPYYSHQYQPATQSSRSASDQYQPPTHPSRSSNIPRDSDRHRSHHR